jgi:hypothetical protein
MPKPEETYVRAMTREQAQARSTALDRADAVLRAADLPTVRERAAQARDLMNRSLQREMRADALIRALLQATTAHANASLPTRLMQAARKDLDKRIGAILGAHFGIRF